MKWWLLVVFLILVFYGCIDAPNDAVDYIDCTIYRDTFGVPHIHGKTDADVAYGLAWASAEDDFITMQEQMIAIRGRLGELKGKDGVIIDIGIQYMGLTTYVNNHFEEVDFATLKLINGYVAGANAYAILHADEVLLDNLFPLRPHDILAGYLLGLVEISGAGRDLQRILEGDFSSPKQESDKGSNAIAFSKKITKEGQTFLAINSHQPMEGWYSWYEAHLISDEGMNILGGTFPGGVTIFHGTNQHLGWAHTVNHADFSDVYLLEMHPDRPLYYKIGEEWLQLEEIDLRASLALAGPLRWPVHRKMYQSVYGLTIEDDGNFYAWRFQARESIRAIEQWYKMNKASSWEEWRSALDVQGIPSTNIVYADKEDNIYFISNGRHHKKSLSLDWQNLITANDQEVIWSNETWPIDSLPQVSNPVSGYVYNTNHTPYCASDSLSNPSVLSVQSTMYHQKPDQQNNRSLRFQELIEATDIWSYDAFKQLKYDRTYPTPLRSMPYDEEPLLHQKPIGIDHVDRAFSALQSWDRSTHPDNTTAPLFLLAKEELRQRYLSQEKIEKDDYVIAITRAVEILVATFGSSEIPLGEFQRHRRGEVDLPLGGGADVLAAIYSRPEQDGVYRAFSGESYIQLVRFDTQKGPIIESINAFGSSAENDSPHYTDQMELFANQKLKPMSLDLEDVKKTAVSKNHPKLFINQE